MKKYTTLYFALLLLLLAISSLAFAQNSYMDMNNDQSSVNQPMSQEDLRVAMRMLWDDHVEYTRNYIISAIGNLGDAEACAQRLLKNQDDIGNAIKPFYGNDAGMKLTSLLREHITIAVDVVKYAKLGEKIPLEKAQARWKANGEQIATFLSGANPNWSKTDCSDMLNRHLALTTDEVTYRLKKEWIKDIDAYDKGHQHMMLFADFLTDGIAKQFPSMMAEE